MKKIFTLITFMLCMATAWGVPARNSVIRHTQPDGTELNLRLVGDEYMHYYLNLSDGTRMRQGEDGHFYPIAKTEIQAMQESANSRRLEVQQHRAQRMEQTRRMSKADGPKRIGSFGNISGQKKGIVILVNFKDKAMHTSHNQGTFQSMFNQAGYSSNNHIGSVADYFRDQSYGLFDLSFDVVGPVTLSNNMSYYGGNNSNDDDMNPGAMIKEACNAVNSQINFADYDWDGDGNVDQVFVIYAGYGENCGADPNTIWPHEWTLTAATRSKLKLDNVWIDTYACCAELDGKSGTNLNGIGTACHEFSHCLGYPDSYDTDYSGGVGMDSYDIMCGGSYNGPYLRGEVPSGYTAYQRWMAGWLTPTELTGPTNITDMPDLGNQPTAYIIYNSSNRNEYFMIENRQSNRWFSYYDGGAAGHGLFITHIDYNSTAWTNNTPNDDPNHQRMTWVPADKAYDNKYTSDFFPGSARVTSFTPSGWNNAGGKWFRSENGSYYSSHTLSRITENTTQGTVSFIVDGGDDGTRYTITYNAGAGSCSTTHWTQTSSSTQKAVLPSATIDSEEWTFVGWSTSDITQTTRTPVLYRAGESYTLTRDETLYAVYSKSESADGVSGSYILDWNAETGLQSKTLGYGNATEYTSTDGGDWVIKAYKNAGLQINKGKNASIKVPECTAPISRIAIEANTAQTFSFSSSDYTGGTTPAVATSTNSAAVSIDLSGKGLTTGYIYTTSGATSITRIEVFYGGGVTTYYATNPSLVSLPTPTINFDEANEGGKALLLGDTYTNAANAHCPGVSLPAIVYSSSKTDVAIIDAAGRVTTTGVGTTTITATVAAVNGQSKTAHATYTVNVSMPTLTSIAITTEPNKTTYFEDEAFETSGMVVTATYSNGFTRTITAYTWTREGERVIISCTEGGVTASCTIDLTIQLRPRHTVTFNSGTGTCSTTSLSETAYQGGVTLPACSDVNSDWIFAGWSTECVSSATTQKPTLYMAGETYQPNADCTLYAVYSMTEGMANAFKAATATTDFADGTPIVISSQGSYKKTLAHNNGTISAINNFTAENGIIICTDESAIWTLNGSNASGYTLSNRSKKLYHSSTSLSVNTSGTTWMITKAAANANRFLVKDKNSTYYVECTSNGWTTYNISGTPSSTQVNNYVGLTLYVPASTATYHSTPNAELATPDIAFVEPNTNGKTLYVGDTYRNGATASNTDQAISYSSSDATVATVSPDGKVTAIKVGQTTITATVPAVTGISIAASASYTVTVLMPELSDIAVSTPPTKRSYYEGETFSTEGMVITAHYANGYEQGITTYSCDPDISTPLTTSETQVTISYTEGEITRTADVSISVQERPKYTVTFNIGNNTSRVTETSYQSGVTPPAVADIEGYVFAGWSTDELGEETASRPTLEPLSNGKYMPSQNIELHAIYSRTEQSDSGETVYTLNTSTTGIPTAYDSNGKSVEADQISFIFLNAAFYSGTSYIQLKANTSNIYNSTILPASISSIVITYDNSYHGRLYVGESANSTQIEIGGSSNGNTVTYDCISTNCRYFTLRGHSTNAAKAKSIVITCGSPSRTYYTCHPIQEYTLALAAHSGANYYATFSCSAPTCFPISGNGYTAKLYSVNLKEGNELALAELNICDDSYYVPSYAGVLIKAQFEGEDHHISYSVVGCLPPDFESFNDTNLLHGASIDKSSFNNHYFYKLAYLNHLTQEGLGFYWGEDNGGPFPSKTGVAYLAIPMDQFAEANYIRGFSFNDSESGTPEIDDTDEVPLIIHTLTGIRIQKIITDGLYIVNGKTKWMIAE